MFQNVLFLNGAHRAVRVGSCSRRAATVKSSREIAVKCAPVGDVAQRTSRRRSQHFRVVDTETLHARRGHLIIALHNAAGDDYIGA